MGPIHCEAGDSLHGDPDSREGKGVSVDSSRRPNATTAPEHWGPRSHDLRHTLPTPLSCHPYSVSGSQLFRAAATSPFLTTRGHCSLPPPGNPSPPPTPAPPCGRPSRFHLQGETACSAREHLFPPICWWRPAGNDNQDLPGSQTCPGINVGGPRFLSTETAEHKDWPFESLKNLIH